ncbi:MAG: hypothetical protein C9356_11735 [Oleiphilus sp.]|nr:MAG: hypothetical protein C9356_11735 [Oleiphilus sp.]
MVATAFYHGSSGADSCNPVDTIAWGIKGVSDASDMMFLSLSPNVARRYGVVYRLIISVDHLPRISVTDRFDRAYTPAGSFIIAGTSSYDFPVDTLVLRQQPANLLCRVMDVDALDDGLAITHDPQNEDDRQFGTYIDDHYAGDLERWRQNMRALNASP